MRKILVFSSFVLGNFAILVVCFLFLTVYTTKQSTATSAAPLETINQPIGQYSLFAALPTGSSQPNFQIVAADARAKLIDDFFRSYNSPMIGLGSDIVIAADKYHIPFGLLPAIAQCEGNLGKAMPPNSFNPYGFGIYGDQMTKFGSWQEGIETVTKTLRRDYFDQGLDTPDKIMKKYTPPSTGSWAFCVNKFLEELK